MLTTRKMPSVQNVLSTDEEKRASYIKNMTTFALRNTIVLKA